MYINSIIILIILCLITFIFYFINNKLNKYEHFLGIYEILNNGFNKKIKENTINAQNIKSNTSNSRYKNMNDVFYSNIYLTYSEKYNKYNFYIFNYERKLFMSVNILKNKTNFDILNQDNKKVGKLMNRHHNKYIIDLQKLYKSDYIYVIQNNYNQIKIYNNFEYNIYYLKKNNDNQKKYKLFLFDDEIGYINNDDKHYKFFIKSKYLKDVSLFSYALIILITNKQS